MHVCDACVCVCVCLQRKSVSKTQPLSVVEVAASKQGSMGHGGRYTAQRTQFERAGSGRLQETSGHTTRGKRSVNKHDAHATDCCTHYSINYQIHSLDLLADRKVFFPNNPAVQTTWQYN